MAEDIVSADRLQAGHDYIAALAKLGFRPDAALWTVGDMSTKEGLLQLTIVSSLVERVGPTALYDLLFQAYEHAGTPKSIDPWIVGLYGAETLLGAALRTKPVITFKEAIFHRDDGSERTLDLMEAVEGRLFYKRWVYIRNFKKRDLATELRQIDAFRKNVERLAA